MLLVLLVAAVDAHLGGRQAHQQRVAVFHARGRKHAAQHGRGAAREQVKGRQGHGEPAQRYALVQAQELARIGV